MREQAIDVSAVEPASRIAVVAMTIIDDEAWTVVDVGGEHRLVRPRRDDLVLGQLGTGVQLAAIRTGTCALLLEGEQAVLVRDERVEQLGVRARDRRVLLGGYGIATRHGGALVYRSGKLAIPVDLAGTAVSSGALVFDGSAALVELDHSGRRTAVLYDLRAGSVRMRIRLGEARILAIAERRGRVVLGRGAHLALFDLRAGRCVGERILPVPAAVCAIDADGSRLVVVDANGATHELAASLADWSAPEIDDPSEASTRDAAGTAPSETSVSSQRASEPSPAASEPSQPASESSHRASEPSPTASEPSQPASESSHRAGEPSEPSQTASEPSSTASEPSQTASKPSSTASEPNQPASEPNPHAIEPPVAATPRERQPTDELSRDVARSLVALGVAPGTPLAGDALAAYLADAHAWVLGLCRSALAAGIECGRIAKSDPTQALTRADAREQESAASRRFSAWSTTGAPHVAIARELGLSSLAVSVLLLAAAPQIWGELARTYGACTGDPARPLVDELLLAHLLDADIVLRAEIGRELDDDAPLVASGAVVVSKGLRPYAALTVHPAIARRLAGAAPATDVADGTPVASCSLADIIGPRSEIADVARALATTMPVPPRIVLRGRAGVGRRTVAAALAARVGRRIALVAIEHGAPDTDIRLRQRLQDVALRGDLPCVVLDGISDDPALRARVRTVIDRHRGPLFVRAPRGGELPLAPGYLAVDFPPLTETARAEAWRSLLAAHGLDQTPGNALAARFGVGPGAIARACAAAVAASARGGAVEAALVTSLRQQRAARIEAVATRVEQLASFADLIVPDEIAESLHELCARVHHRRTVLEDWGRRGHTAKARGVTALFQGGPGTGKTMAAEAVAHALGYELWRVDLSKVVSKWIGETEKNLAAVFDAAEDGEIVLLFDEADSLFGKRTEVKSSNDRNANLETNYLLQRLDTFTGIAILTTNFGTSIDPAFQRRLAVQAQFPFPDEHDRERLWRAHLPATLPVAEQLDLGELSRKYPLTGGYIRNAVLRAAYLAAGRGTPLATADLERAVRAEYAARGKVSANGALL